MKMICFTDRSRIGEHLKEYENIFKVLTEVLLHCFFYIYGQ